MPNAKFTQKGLQKLGDFLAAVRSSWELAAAREVDAVRNMASTLAPSPAEEARILSEGVIADSSPFAGATVGTPEGGRFIRQGQQVSMQEAIRTDRIEVQQAGTTSLVGTGRPSRINRRTGFYWNTRRRGIQGPTEPFNRALVQSYEYGGIIYPFGQWTVEPRPGTGKLEPEPGVSALRMTKTVEPYFMYTNAGRSLRTKFIRNVAFQVSRDARRAGRK